MTFDMLMNSGRCCYKALEFKCNLMTIKIKWNLQPKDQMNKVKNRKLFYGCVSAKKNIKICDKSQRESERKKERKN